MRRGYSFTYPAAETRYIRPTATLGRARSDLPDPKVRVNVRWKVRGADYSRLMAFYRTATEGGSLDFTVPLMLESTAVEDHLVSMVPGSMQSSALSGGSMEVSAVLEVEPLPEYDEVFDEAIMTIGEELGLDYELSGVLTSFEELVAALPSA